MMKIPLPKISAILFIAFISIAFAPLKVTELELGKKMPLQKEKLILLDGSKTTLKDHIQENGLLVVFSCNTCPYVLAWENRYNDIHTVAKENKVGMIVLNPNEAQRDGVDSLEAMKSHAEKNGYTFPYVIDKDHKVADAMGATRTPHIFLFDKEGVLVYRGAIDDNYKDKNQVKKFWLRDALVAIGLSKEIPTKTTKSLGCSIKRV